MAIEYTDVGAWLLRGNPDSRWDYWAKRHRDRPPSGKRLPTDGSLGRNYRNGLMDVGDKIALYVGGSSQQLVEIGTVTSRVKDEDEWDPDFVIDEAEGGRMHPIVEFDTVLLARPLSKSTMLGYPELAEAEFIRQRQGTNPSYLTHNAVGALLTLLDPREAREAGWT